MAAFGESWLISAMIRFTSNGARVMNELGGAALNANKIVDEHTKKVDAATQAWNRFSAASIKAGTVFAGGMFAAGVATIGYGINQAAKLELAMTGVYAATGASIRQQTQLRNLVISLSGQTAQSATTIANEAYMAASSGLNNPNRLISAFPQIAKAADVLWLSTMGTPKAVNPVDATVQMVKLSHLFGAYSGKPLHDMIDFATRLQMVQPDALSKVVTQAKYFVPTAVAAGIDMRHLPESDMAMALSTMGQTGLFGGRGGTGLARYIEYMMKAPVITAHLSKIQRASMIDLGLFDQQGRNRFLDPNGNFELMKSLHYLGTKFDDWAKHGQRSRYLGDIFGAFLQTGGQYAMTMTLPAVRAQQAQNILAMQRIAPAGAAVETLWDKYMHTTVGAWKYFVTNFQNIWLYLFTPMLPDITKLLRDMGYQFGRFGNTLKDNPGLAKHLADLAFALTAFAGIRFVGGGVLWAIELLGAFRGIAPGGRLAAAALKTVDNVLLAGLTQRLVGFGRALGSLTIATTAAGEVTTVATALHALAIAGGAFLASPLGRLIGAAAPLLTGIKISQLQGQYDKADYGAVAGKYGYRYANYIMRTYGAGGLGVSWPSGLGGKPDPNMVFPTGALSPGDYDRLNPQGHQHVVDAIKDGFKSAATNITVTVVDKTTGGVRSLVSSRGNMQSNRYVPKALQLDLASPSLGLDR